MSYKQYFKAASQKKTDSVVESKEPAIDRFSDIQSVDRRRHEVLDYMLIGLSPEEIAETMDEELLTIERDVEKIVEVGYAARDEEVEQVRDEVMTVHRLAVKESFKAFKLSQGQVETITTEYENGDGRADQNGERKIKSEKIKKELQSGDSRHIKNMIDAAKEMGKVSGAQKHKEVEVQTNIQNNQVNILSPNKTQVPNDFDRWTKKPDGEELPDGENENFEDI